jgi:NADPH-dependent 2,4-dienoyl-CoA reductase/sulfur reductase-like enzyme
MIGGVDEKRRRLLQAAALAMAARAAPGRGASRARVVVVGGGFAGAACALALRRIDATIDIALIDAEADYVSCPMSNAALVGWRSMDSIKVSRAGLARSGIRIAMGRVVGIDAASHSVRLADGTSMPYDRLVVAPGIRFLWNAPEGYDEAASKRMPHAWVAGAQTELLARQLRAMDDGGIVAISVPAGLMRCPPGPFERASVVAAWLQKNKPRSKILIFDANNHFPRQEVFSAAWKELYPGKIEWVPSTEGGAVMRVDVESTTLHTGNGAQRVAVANVIPPQAPAQLAVDAGIASGHGWCPVDPLTFESTLVRKVHVIGDACIAGAMPKSASAAYSQALQCARSIAALLQGHEPPQAEFDSVCYSLLAQDHALSIHGRFAVNAGEIESQPLPSPTRAPSATEEAALAQQWYQRIVADSFGL